MSVYLMWLFSLQSRGSFFLELVPQGSAVRLVISKPGLEKFLETSTHFLSLLKPTTTTT